MRKKGEKRRKTKMTAMSDWKIKPFLPVVLHQFNHVIVPYSS